MIHHEPWYKEALGERDIDLLIQKIIRTDKEEGEVPEVMMQELTSLAKRAGMVEEVLRKFPEDFPVFLEPPEDFEDDVHTKMFEDFSDWAPDFDLAEINLMRFSCVEESYEGTPRLTREQALKYGHIDLTVEVEVEGHYPVDPPEMYGEEEGEEDYFAARDEQLSEAMPDLRNRFFNSISNPGRQNAEGATVDAQEVEEGPSGEWGWSFSGSFSYDTAVDVNPEEWKIVYGD